MLHPLKFKPIFKDKIWGGQKIRTVLGKDFGDLPNCGETWELSGVEGNVSVVAEGGFKNQDLKMLIQQYKGDLVGQSVFEKFGDKFPLLIKFIDANQDLSIQVHPNDQLAKSRHNSRGKTEMWYVMQADEEASLVSGFNRALDREKYLKYFNSGRLTEILNRELVQGDDVYFLPAGRVHTIGRGILLAEIQQTSDITYRIYDFDRVDSKGNKRELHVEEALHAIDYKFYDQYKTPYSDKKNERTKLVSCPYFTTNKLVLDRNFDNCPATSGFKIYIGIEGTGNLRCAGEQMLLRKGDVVLIPACISDYVIEPSGEVTLLESYIEG